MALEASNKALTDAKVAYNQIEQVAVGYVYGKWNLNIITVKKSWRKIERFWALVGFFCH